MAAPLLKKKPLLVGAGITLIAASAIGFIVYLNTAFPEVRCEAAEHLTAPDELGDCYSCHAKVTPVLAQDWQESKHGAILVKCFVCHGQPDGLGAIPFSVKPSERNICSRCHEPSMNRMEQKFGEMQSCSTCHPRHQNPMHRSAFESVSSSGKTDF